MVRTQIQLTEEQNQRLREIAMKNRESMASLIRKAIDQFLMQRKPDRSALYRQASAVVGKYKAGARDVSENHDRHLAEAFQL